MPSLTARGMSFLNRKLKASASDEVRYFRGASVCEGLLATRGQFATARYGEGEETFTSEQIDFTFERSHLRMDGVPVDPLLGDTIQARDGEYLLTFEVQPNESGKPFEASGPSDTRIRVHTKQIARQLA